LKKRSRAISSGINRLISNAISLKDHSVPLSFDIVVSDSEQNPTPSLGHSKTVDMVSMSTSNGPEPSSYLRAIDRFEALCNGGKHKLVDFYSAVKRSAFPTSNTG
jgi:hypothetical protein